jgi:3-hydroxyisobutyrate dehydrogenase-like beta-hydroxyacid dehydrogenase
MTSRTRVTVFGLGEAGSTIAADLVRAAVEVHGYDPASVPTPPGVTRHDSPGPSVHGSEMILALTAAEDAQEAITQALQEMGPGTTYADLSTAAPALKQDLAEIASSRGLSFVDVALMGTVPVRGLGTPALASGPGALRYAELINGLGGNVEVIGNSPGDAAARKLLRSVVTKGLTALLLEAMEAARTRGESELLWQHLVELITDADESLLDRFMAGTSKHIGRRLVEMESARDFIESLGVPAPMTTATVETLRRIKTEGMPPN